MYQTREDSFFMSEVLLDYFKSKNLARKRALDLGTGSVIQAETLAKFFRKNNILCSDIDEEAVKFARKKGFSSVKSALFENIKERFDFIVFNAPYLPENEFDKEKDTTGGKKGDEVILRFLKQAKNHLNKHGTIFL